MRFIDHKPGGITVVPNRPNRTQLVNIRAKRALNASRMRLLKTALLSGGLVAGLAGAAEWDLTQLSIEDLMELKVVSATKTEQNWQDTAAAVFVITADDIRRSGATSLPEVLRLAPGVEAARIDASRWSVTIRGFSGRFANKLLVLVDGRSIYTPLFSGVHWEVQGPPLEQIARIEVIRGPGGSLWGANAVNGIINIITKPATQEPGGRISLAVGDEERTIASGSYSGSFGDQAAYRLYGQFAERDSLVTPGGQDAGDDWRIGKGGLRVDWKPSVQDTVTVQGEVYRADFDQNFQLFNRAPPYADARRAAVRATGGSAQVRWERQLSANSRWSLQTYYQFEDREDPLYSADLDIFDLDFQHSFALGARQEIVWGLGYRRSQDQFTDTHISQVRPAQRSTQQFSAFVQDQVELIPQRWRLIGGLKLEHNAFTGWEWQPSLRTLWTPHPDHRLWAAVSRAVRTPSRGEWDAAQVNLMTMPPSALTGGLPVLFAFRGSHALESEALTAYEIGYRWRWGDQLSADATLFRHDYDRLITAQPLGAPVLELRPAPHLFMLTTLADGGSGQKTGFELAADWRPAAQWRLRFGYSYLDSDLSRESDGATIYSNGHRQQFSLLSSWNPHETVDVDVWWRYVNSQEKNPTLTSRSSISNIEPYASLDLRLGWRPRKDLEFSLMGRNVLRGHHLEMVQEAFAFPVEVERSIYGQVKWAF